ncbi:unnamed protein product [Ectocarpus sp. 6 AP-2014]
MLAAQQLTYAECEQYLPLRDGDVVFVIKLHDGDTCTLAWVDHRGKKVRSSCRISGIDTPEIRGSSEEEKSLAVKAKDKLEKALVGQFATVRNPRQEKYGRVLCDLETSAIASIKAHMLSDASICHPYDGGKKEPWLSPVELK